MLNEKAMQIYEYIRSRIDSGYAPTVREICTALDIKSTSTAHRYIKTLVDAGLLDKMDGSNRAIRLHGHSAQNVPLIGRFAAGVPVMDIENITDYISFVPDRQYDGKLFAFKMSGDSMTGAGILDGDTLIAEQCSIVENGAIAVMLVNETETAVMRFYREDGTYRLQPDNAETEALHPNKVTILGRIIALIRYMQNEI